MADVVVVTPNPAVDVTYCVDRQVVGQTLRVHQVARRAGGKGLNVARVLHRLGVDVLAVHPLGGDSGAWTTAELQRAGVPAVPVPVPGETRTTVTVTDPTSHPTVLAEPGAEVDTQAWVTLLDVVAANCRPGTVVVVSGSSPPGFPAERLADLVRRNRTCGARSLVDVSGAALAQVARAGADLVFPNAEEAVAATGAADAVGAAAALRAAGAREVVVSCGADGLLGLDADGSSFAHPAVPGVHGNPTGAGDAATAGVAAAWSRGLPLPVALRWAALLGAAAVLQPGAGEVDPADLAELSGRTPPRDDAQRNHPYPRTTGPMTTT